MAETEEIETTTSLETFSEGASDELSFNLEQADFDTSEPIVIEEAKTSTKKTFHPIEFLKGHRPDDALLAGMWSFHFDGEGEFSKYFYNTSNPKNFNEVNNLVGLQYASLFAATFTNSHDRQTFLAGVTRNIINKELGKSNLFFQSGYRAGIIYGYGDQFPNLGGFSPVIFLTAGLKYKIFGVELNYAPGTPVVGVVTRVNFAPIINMYKSAKNSK